MMRETSSMSSTICACAFAYRQVVSMACLLTSASTVPSSLNLDHRRGLQRRQVEIEIAGDDARDIEYVVDDLRLRLRVSANRFDGLLAYFVVDGPVFQQPGPPEDCS